MQQIQYVRQTPWIWTLILSAAFLTPDTGFCEVLGAAAVATATAASSVALDDISLDHR